MASNYGMYETALVINYAVDFKASYQIRAQMNTHPNVLRCEAGAVL